MQPPLDLTDRMPSSTIARYGAAVIAVAVATFVRMLLDPWLGSRFPFATLFFAVLAVAWYGGFGPAAVAAVMGAIVATWLLFPPRGVFVLDGLENKVGIALYLLISLGMALLGGAMRESRLRAERLAKVATDQSEQLADSEARYRQIVEEAHEGVWQLDVDGRTRFANRRMAEMLHCSIEELRASSVADFLDEQGRREILQLRERRRQGISEQVEIRFWRKDHTELWALVSASPVYDAAGAFDGVLGMISDVTRRKQME
jgi:PAS domain S-box-containing protein